MICILASGNVVGLAMYEDDPRVVYLLSVLNDLYHGEWECRPEGDNKLATFCDRRVVVFLFDHFEWLGFNLDNDYIIGVGCRICQRGQWGEWQEFDFTDDALVRSELKRIIGLSCKCVYLSTLRQFKQ
jgi:hypothetical protein